MSQAAVEERRERLRTELERVRQVLAADPWVRRLFLFGPLATAEVHEWSDLDLVVVMETPLGFLDRGLEVRRLVRPGVGTDIVVYTPEELRRLQQRLFVQEEILLAKEGRPVPRTHKVDDLWKALPESVREALTSLEDELGEMDQYYAVTRYPDALGGTRPQGLPDREHAGRPAGGGAVLGSEPAGGARLSRAPRDHVRSSVWKTTMARLVRVTVVATTP